MGVVKKIIGGRTLVLALLLLILILLVPFFVMRWRSDRQAPPATSLVVLYLGRELGSTLDQMNVKYLEFLIGRHNSNGSSQSHLVLETEFQTKTTDLESLYKKHSRRTDLALILDNGWGSEIKKALSTIKGIRAPVIFLNGDRNKGPEKENGESEALDFGPGRLFLGAGDLLPSKMLPLIDDLVGTGMPWAFVYESPKAYSLSGEFLRLFDKPDHVALGSGKRIPLNALQIQNRAEISKIHVDIRSAFKDPQDDTAKLIVLNVHRYWGTELIEWIGREFQNTTIIAYQSAVTSGKPIFVQNASNQLILLGQTFDSVPGLLHDDHLKLVEQHAKLFCSEDDVFYMRRIAVAMSLGRRAINTALDITGGSSRTSSVIRNEIEALKGQEIETELGLIRFDKDSIERGNDRLILRRRDLVTAYPMQLNREDKLVPNLRFGVEDLRVSSIDIRNGTFHANFQLWINCEDHRIRPLVRSQSNQGVNDDDDLPTLVLSLLDIGNRAGELKQDILSIQRTNTEFKPLSAEESVPTSRPSTPRPTGFSEYRYLIDGDFHLPSMSAFWFPFDWQHPSITLRVQHPDSRLQASADPDGAEHQHSVDGWDVVDSHITFKKAMPAEKVVPLQSQETFRREQYNQGVLQVSLRRQVWSALLMVFLPLFAIAAASLAVLYVRVTRDGEDVAQMGSSSIPGNLLEPQANHPETFKTQAELTLVCVVALLAYWVSYGSFTPGSEQVVYSDILLGATLLFTSTNFLFIVAMVNRRKKAESSKRALVTFRAVMCLICAMVFGGWLVFGFAASTRSYRSWLPFTQSETISLETASLVVKK